MRVLRNLAALVALACVGFALGDWASHPNAVGMLGICLLVVVLGVLLSFLFGFGPRRRRGQRLHRPPPPPPPPGASPPRPDGPRKRRRPSLSGPPAGWGDDKDE